MKAVVTAFNQEKALVGAFSVITNLRMDLFEALVSSDQLQAAGNYTAGSGNGSNASMLQLPPSPRHRHPPPQSVGRRIRLLHPSLVGGDKEHEKSAMTHSRQ